MGGDPIINKPAEVLVTGIDCGGSILTVLEAGHKHKIFLTDADWMREFTGGGGGNIWGITFINPRMGCYV
jgi:hypothetical protein